MSNQLLNAKRILVLGSSGSGKTTFARQLHELLGIELIHLDTHFWKPGWISTPVEIWREHVATLAARPAWIMDGTYEQSLDLRMPRADFVVVLERSRLQCLFRVVKRKLTNDSDARTDAPARQPVGPDFVRYIWRHATVTRPVIYKSIQKYGKNDSLLILKGDQEIRLLLDSVRLQQRQSPSTEVVKNSSC